MKTVTATVVYTICVNVNVDDDASDHIIREKILDEAGDAIIDGQQPIIHDCSEEDLID